MRGGVIDDLLFTICLGRTRTNTDGHGLTRTDTPARSRCVGINFYKLRFGMRGDSGEWGCFLIFLGFGGVLGDWGGPLNYSSLKDLFYL